MKKILQVMIVAIIALNLIATPNSLKAGNPQGVVMTKFFNSTQMNSPSVINSFDKVFDMGSNLSGKMIVSIDNKPMLAVYKLNSGKCDWHKWNGTQWVYQYSLGNIVPGFEEPRTLNTYKYATWDEYTMHVVDTGNGDVVTPTNTLAVALAGPTSGKINTTYTYTATITGGTIPYTLAWSADGFVSQSGTSTNYKWATSGTKKVEVYVTDSLGQTGSANLNVTIIDNYTLTVNINPPGAGSVTPSGGSYTSGTVVTLTETPIASYKFVNWSGDATGSGSSVTVTMNSNKTVTANFAINYYTVTFVDWNGTVLKTQSVAYGGSATPPANPARTGYTFAGWSGSYTNVTSNRTITATYTTNTYTITASAGTGGSISPSGAITVNYGSSKSFTITANAGYKISSVTVDGSSVGAVSSYTFSNVTSNHTINASFTIIPLSVSISGPTEGKLNTSYTYTSSVSGGKTPYTYSWLVFDGSWSAAGSGTSCSHSWSHSGTGAVYLAITDALGQTVGNGVYITIYSPPTVSISGPTSGKPNTSYTYTSSVSGGKTPYTYRWLVWRGTSWTEGGSGTSCTCSWSAPGSYWIYLIVTDALRQQVGSNAVYVTIYSTPTVTISGTTKGKINTNYTYTPTVSGGKTPYTYAFSGGGTPATGTGSTFTTQWSTVSFRTVSLTVTDSLGQIGSASLIVTISEPECNTHWVFDGQDSFNFHPSCPSDGVLYSIVKHYHQEDCDNIETGHCKDVFYNIDCSGNKIYISTTYFNCP